ncbi:unnamed protein product [Dovyalis caffra]|uniref:Ycf2 n=1 Tax=Dovyalis caffra TaxID=77055 RepID=A0AAV1SBT8_9ROSI|nr:unnamed protein product [Dovyalis caffra]
MGNVLEKILRTIIFPNNDSPIVHNTNLIFKHLSKRTVEKELMARDEDEMWFKLQLDRINSPAACWTKNKDFLRREKFFLEDCSLA